MLSNLETSPNSDSLKTAIYICRFIGEISKYKKELCLQISQTFNSIPVSVVYFKHSS